MRRMCLALLLVVVSLAHGSSVPDEHVRSPDQTFLTFPEWFLVHSPAEYATYLGSDAPPSAFPLFAHIGQFWQSYAAVNREIAKYPCNAGYHLMVMVIGVSTTVEYGLKGLYERTVGRLAETMASAPVPEEAFAAEVAQKYVDFIRVDPWYLFDFQSPLKRLWATIPLSGPNLIRRWERRFLLTSELLIKSSYGQLIRIGSEAVYGAAKPVTVVRLSRAPTPDAQYPDYQTLGLDGRATVPRYEGFRTYSLWLASQGIDFHEIAGNDGDILVSLLVSKPWAAQGVRTLFEQPVLTRPGTRRVVVVTTVPRLAGVLRQALATPGVVVEHVYDY